MVALPLIDRWVADAVVLLLTVTICLVLLIWAGSARR